MSISHEITYALLAVLVNVHLSQCNCANKWVSIDPASYAETYVKVSASNAATLRPLGYMPITVSFGQNPKACVTVENAGGNGRHYEISLDSPSGAACVQPEGGEQLCENGRTSKCSVSTGDTITFTFDCDSCEGSQVTFWYRIVVESDTDGQYDENWCQSRTPKYPEGLKDTGETDVIPTPVTKTPDGSSANVSANWILVTILLACSVGLLFHEE